MRILVLTNLYPPEFLGGYELGCHQMVAELRRTGHEVRVITTAATRPPEPESESESEGVERTLELAPVYNQERMRSVSRDVQQLFHLRSTTVNLANIKGVGNALAEFQPDVAYLWNLLGIGGLGLLGLLRQQGIPWVWHLMDSIPRQMCGFLSSDPWLARELNDVFPGRYVACSSHVLGEIRVGSVNLGDEVALIPNWVHGEPPQPRTQFRDGGHLRLMTASGSLNEPKGTHILIEAAARLRQAGHADFSLDIYGAEEDPRFRAMLHEHSVEDVVTLAGPRPHRELLEQYAAYDVFAFPTWSREPFAFAPLEAAAAGCLPLLSADCGNAEWMIDGVDCLKAARSPEAFAERIAEILRGEADLEGIARRAQAVVWREFHIRTAAAAVERELATAAGQRRPARGPVGDFYGLASLADGVLAALLAETRGSADR